MSEDSYHLSHEDLARPVLVKKSPRAKRMTLRVSSSQRDVILTIPRRTGSRKAGAFLEQHIDWLNQQLEQMPEPVPFESGRSIPFLGQPHELVFCGPRTRKQTGQDVVTIKSAQDKEPDGDQSTSASLQILGAVDHAPRRLKDWLKKQAKQKLVERVDVHAKRLGLTYTRLGVRDQTSRWGSCSSNKTLSFSWRLILAPEAVLDYVAAHEVAHLREMNHSDRFWALVAKTLPGHDDARQWLRQNGQDLYRYGANE
ncbi:MAG: M48 family metallopeptidase [bacterium]|nr:M48 family metallopeptidase [bacterium]